ncbi:MAG: DUF4126 domain-containing protein [Stenotrophomonas sp.]
MSEAHIFTAGILLAWLAGIRVYLTVFGVGIAGVFGWVDLPPALQATTSWWVLGTSGALALVEFFADKLPGVDSVWDLLQTLTRVPAGAFLAAAALSPDGELSNGVLAAGAGVALTSHSIKSGARMLLNTSPEPVSNWMASLWEDAVAFFSLLLAAISPVLAMVFLIGASVVIAALVWMTWSLLRRGVRRFLARPARDVSVSPNA